MKRLLPLFLLVACGDKADRSPEPVPLDAGTDPVCTSCAACEERFEVQGASHIDGDLQYDDPPPVGGDHNPTWARWGVHGEPVPDQCFVHNLEHGGMVLLYHCASGCEAEVSQLEAFVADHPRTLLTSYDEMPEGFAVVTWGRRLVSTCLDMAAIGAFYDAYLDQAPESIPADPARECK